MSDNTKKSFTNRIALISGGLGDIGRSIAAVLAGKGADIALGDIQPGEKADELLQSLEAMGVRARYTSLDVSRAGEVRNWVEESERELGIPDIIVANAATVTMSTIHGITPEQWDDELRVNLNGPFYLAKFATEKMVEKKLPGHVVLIGSWAAHVVHAHIPAYSVSKAGLRMLGKCLALELAPHNIMVNEVAPGYVDAGLSARIWEADPSLRQQSEGVVPVGRLISPEEVAAQVIYLCDRNNRHITGSTLLMDGGLSLLSV